MTGNHRGTDDSGARPLPGFLLSTKLSAPGPRTQVIPRGHLVERLEGSSSKLTLVSAPVGFGKTTLVASWLRDCQRPTAWYSLDANDNDLDTFFSYVATALERVDPDLGKGIMTVLRSPEPAAAMRDGESLARILLRDAETAPDGMALVFDDYHVIDDASIHAAASHLVELAPPGLRIVIVTREDPPLPLARLRGRGQLLEDRASDLAFTPEETSAFMGGPMGLDLTDEQLGALGARTEGWVAGLQLAALSMQGREDVGQFIADFAGDDRYIMGYLVEEVLERQGDQRRSFLLETAVLERLSGPLCDAVTGRNDGQATLEQLERSNLFLVPLDSRREWYRYHHLLGDLLRRRLSAMDLDAAMRSNARASEWHERAGTPEEAIRYAINAGDGERAAELVERYGPGLLMASEIPRLLTWLGRLPDEAISTRPRLSLIHAWGLRGCGRIP